MKTSFTPGMRQVPALAEAERILRSCVHCGFCTATCPSYQVLGDERDSPRGRIALIKAMLEGGRKADATIARHMDRCLSCFACTTTCPSGVDYIHLSDLAREKIEQDYRRPLPDRLLRAALAAILPRPRLFRTALILAGITRPLAPLLPARLRAMLALAPSRLPAPDRTGGSAFAAEGAAKGRVALMPGCAQSVLDPGINAAAIRLLTRHGRAVAVLPQGQCCGALPRHMGRTAAARALARPVIRALLAEPGLDALVVTTSGCGSVIKDYAALFRGEGDEAEARRAAALARDLSELLDPAELKPTRPPLRVAYHAACSLQHGQKVTSQPVALLQAAGAMPLIPRDAHLCCGSAGTYNLLQPAIAGELARRKAAALAELSPQVIVTGNIGCMTQIGAAQAVPVIHLAEYLDWATGGPVPAKIAHLATEAPE